MDGTQIEAWASMKSFKAKDGSDDDKPSFKGTKRSNKTHASKPDPDAKLLRKGKGQESMLCHPGDVLVDSVSGLRKLGIRAHPRAKKKHSALDGRMTEKPSYEASMKRRYLPDPVFGWVKNRGRMRQTMLHGTDKVDWQFHLYCMAYNLGRMAAPA